GFFDLAKKVVGGIRNALGI
uniref:Uperin-2.3 n=1 Tax=Uperoleia inundata TaxID=104953 RepID=UPE23_UPEIN|nr:RecName: Full=Uperin-2.3 [Uperoleia inundata]